MRWSIIELWGIVTWRWVWKITQIPNWVTDEVEASAKVVPSFGVSERVKQRDQGLD